MMSLPEIFRKTISFLETEGNAYLVIGGIAAAVLGYPRLTQDIDICIQIKKKEVLQFLKKAESHGFTFNKKEVIKRIKETGTFQIKAGDFHVDFLILSTEFEKSALRRRQKIVVYDIPASLPTPEDLILFKIVPARYIDLADVENIAKRYFDKLDKKYLTEWAQKLSDEAEDMRIYNQIKKILT